MPKSFEDWKILKDLNTELFGESVDTSAPTYTGNVYQDTGGRGYYLDGEKESLLANLRRYQDMNAPKKDVPVTPMSAEQSLGIPVDPPQLASTPGMSLPQPIDETEVPTPGLPAQVKTKASKSPLEDVAPALQATSAMEAQLGSADDELKTAQEKARMSNLFANMLRAGTTIGAAIGTPGKTPDQSFSDQLAKQADQPVQDIKEQRSQLDKKIEREASLESLKNTKEFTNPDSAISKLYREEADRIGVAIPPGATAKQIHQILPMIESRIKHEDLMATKKELALKEAELKKERQEVRTDEKKDAFTQSVRREMTAGKLGELFQSYSAGVRGLGVLENAIKDPSGYKDFASVFATLKSTQGDSSVIREAEMRLGLSLGSIPEKMHGNVVKFFTGEMLAPSQRQKMYDSLKMLTEQSKRAYLSAVKPALAQAKRLNIPTEELTGVPLTDDGEISKEQLSKEGLISNPKTEALAQKLMTNNPGLTKEQAIDVLKKKGYIK
jgi:hypothetical protein